MVEVQASHIAFAYMGEDEGLYFCSRHVCVFVCDVKVGIEQLLYKVVFYFIICIHLEKKILTYLQISLDKLLLHHFLTKEWSFCLGRCFLWCLLLFQEAHC